MTVSELIAELQKLPGDALVRVSVISAKDTVFATKGDVSVTDNTEYQNEVCISGWAANTRMNVITNNCDGEEDEDEDEDEESEED